jgi:2-dehydro-3-deoxygluconokinase
MAQALGVIGEGLVELRCVDDDDGLRCGFGGDVANTAVMAARLGATARLCGRVGDDLLGQRLVAFWRSSGIELGAVAADPRAPTGLYVNERVRGGAHRFLYHRAGSAGSRLVPDDVTDEFLCDLGWLHYSGVTLAVSETSAEAAAAAVRRARMVGTRISFAINHRPALAPDAAALAAAARDADVVFVSLEEAAVVFGTDDEAALALQLGRACELVVTAGGDGAAVHHRGAVSRVAAPAVDVVDAAGAGDALAGAYLAARIGGAAPADALPVGVAAASLSCAADGCALSYPDAPAVAEAAAAMA